MGNACDNRRKLSSKMLRNAENTKGYATLNDCDPVLLSSLRAEAEGALEEGVRNRKSPWRCLSLATVGRDGDPELRNMVLRGFDPTDRKLRFHTDVRSAKWAQLEQRPIVSVLGYDQARQLQIRLRGVATCHHNDATAQAAWDKSHLMSRACYAAAHDPGTPVDGPPSAPAYCETGAQHFGALVARYAEMEVLKLSSGGHLRARFWWNDETYHETWLAP